MEKNTENNNDITNSFNQTIEATQTKKVTPAQLETYKQLRENFLQDFTGKGYGLTLNQAFFTFIAEEANNCELERHSNMLIWVRLAGLLQCINEDAHPENTNTITLELPLM